MSGIACPNCGLLVSEGGHVRDNVLYCCRGCAERTFCVCRVRAGLAAGPAATVASGRR